MTDDLVKRLREAECLAFNGYGDGTFFLEEKATPALAADRIEALTAENERLNEALRKCVMAAADWARQAGEAKGKLEGSEMPGIVDGWKAENQELRSEIARLREIIKPLAASTGCCEACECLMKLSRKARAALEPKP